MGDGFNRRYSRVFVGFERDDREYEWVDEHFTKATGKVRNAFQFRSIPEPTCKQMQAWVA